MKIANFVKHTSCPKCSSSDGCALYDDGSMHCFVAGCGYTVVSDEYKEEYIAKKKSKIRKEVMQKDDTAKPVKEKEAISDEKALQIKEETSTRWQVIVTGKQIGRAHV